MSCEHPVCETVAEAAVSYPSEQQRRELCAATDATLDDAPAVITGWRLPFAKVSRRDGHGGAVEFAWATVALIMEQDRRFRS